MFYLSIALLITIGSGYFLYKKRIHELGYGVISILEGYCGHLTESEIQKRLRKKGEFTTLWMVQKTCRQLEKAKCVVRHIDNTPPFLFVIKGGARTRWNYQEPFKTRSTSW